MTRSNSVRLLDAMGPYNVAKRRESFVVDRDDTPTAPGIRVYPSPAAEISNETLYKIIDLVEVRARAVANPKYHSPRVIAAYDEDIRDAIKAAVYIAPCGSVELPYSDLQYLAAVIEYASNGSQTPDKVETSVDRPRLPIESDVVGPPDDESVEEVEERARRAVAAANVTLATSGDVGCGDGQSTLHP